MPATRSTGRNGLPMVTLAHATGATAEVYLQGAQVTSWKTPNGDELLFVSELARFERGRGIRGGIPILFPQFGAGPLPHHGFARTLEWDLVSCGYDPAGDTSARLLLTDSVRTRAIWPHAFEAELEVVLADTLHQRLTISNTGAARFAFTSALHTYFAISRIEDLRIDGLRGRTYRDKTRDGLEVVDDHPTLTISAETDRVYLDAPGPVEILDPGASRRLRVERDGFPDVVVWNPWIGWSREHDDFGDDEYRRMVCVEPGVIRTPVALDPGERWSAGQLLVPGRI
jgi:glucose-6-phosphate 1-epimerase